MIVFPRLRERIFGKPVSTLDAFMIGACEGLALGLLVGAPIIALLLWLTGWPA